jgi:23S rRNA pseudouridine2605 synthase
MSLTRLQKFLAQCGVASRRKAELLISGGKVKVNGQIVRELGTSVTPGKDRVEVNGRLVREEHRGVLLLNKPRGIVSTLSDPHGRKTVAGFLSHQFKSYFPVGRLDYESSGLMIMTNDGEMAERLLHPRYELERIYEVEVEGAVTQAVLREISRGVKLDDGMARAKVKLLESFNNRTLLQVSISEGRNRIIRRIMDSVGHPVTSLVRISHGPFKLGRLRPGEIRRLTERDYQFFRRKVMAASDSDS